MCRRSVSNRPCRATRVAEIAADRMSGDDGRGVGIPWNWEWRLNLIRHDMGERDRPGLLALNVC
jgi:hypothetical protein